MRHAPHLPPIAPALALCLVLAGCGGQQDTATASAGQVRLAGAPPVSQGGASAAVPQGAATPAMVFSGALANYTISQAASGYLVTDNTGAEQPRAVAATARLRFSDTSLSFDVDGLPGQAYRLYRAAFARTPDVAGLGFWLGALDQGSSLDSVAQGFTDSAEFKALYANANTSAAIVNQYYVNVLGRKGESDGVTYWSGLLDNKVPISTVLMGFSDSPENKSGAAAGVKNGIVYQESGVNYPDAVHAFPLRAAMHQRNYTGGTDFLTITGSCKGYAAFANAAPVSTTFEGSAALATATTVSLGLTTCTPTSLGWTLVDYYDSADALLGHAESGEYDVSGAQCNLPVAARIGDKGTYAAQSRYTDNTRQGSPGQRAINYTLEADGNSASTAILKLTALHATAAGQLTLTRTSSYRIGINGALDQIAVDELYSNGIHLVYTQNPATAQPAKLTATDTLVGSGAVAQNGRTLTVNYSGWLYDPTVNGYKGALFDSSAGRGTFSFTLGAGAVIQGWEQGVGGMQAGGKRTLLIPSNLGYGTTGAGASIPGNAALVFEVELVSVK